MARFIKNTSYNTLQGLEEEIESLIGSARSAVEAVTLGNSTEGHPIKAFCFGDGDFRKPELLYYALTHSIEFIGAQAALEVIRHLASGGSAGALERINVWVLPVLNPDGYEKVEKQLSTGIGIGFARKNARGVDLNRNFPVAFYHIPRSLFSGSPLRISPHYRGAEPCSEAESVILRDFILGRNFRMSLSFHSFGGSILFPYSHISGKCRDHDDFMATGEEMARRQREPYSVEPSYNLYQMNGSIDDWMYDECGILALVMEIGRLPVRLDRPGTWFNPFYWANPVEPRAEIDNILPASLYLMEAVERRFTGSG